MTTVTEMTRRNALTEGLVGSEKKIHRALDTGLQVPYIYRWRERMRQLPSWLSPRRRLAMDTPPGIAARHRVGAAA